MSITLYNDMEIRSIRTPMGDLKVTASHGSDDYYDLFIDLERVGADGVRETMQVCVVTVHDFDGPSIHIYPYNTTDEIDIDCDDDLVVRTDGDRWYK